MADPNRPHFEDDPRYTPAQKERMRKFADARRAHNEKQKAEAAARRAAREAAGPEPLSPQKQALRDKHLPKPKDPTPYWLTPSGRAESRREEIIRLVEKGESFAAACRAVDISPTYLQRLRAKDPDFNARLMAARVRADEAKEQIKASKPRLDNRKRPVAAHDFVTFRQDYFNHETAPHQLLMVEQIERAKPGEIVLILAFPGAGKSTLITDYLCHRVAHDPNIRIASISKGQDLARKGLGQIATRMTDTQRFPKYITHFGPFRAPVGSVKKDFIGRATGNPWTADYIRVFKATHDEKDYTIESKGWGSALYGGRYDLMIYDDLQDSKNLNLTDNILTWLRQDALTRPGHHDGGNIIIGSRVGRGDLYETLIDEQMVTRTVKIPALDRWVDRDDMYVFRNGQVIVNPNCEARPTWDAWTLHSLAQRRHLVKEEIWTRTYMQKDFTPADATFTEHMLESVKDRALPAGQTNGTYRILTVDPALESGICAFLVTGCSEDDLWLTDLITSKNVRRYEDIYAQISSLAARYRPNVVVVEQNNFQKGMLQDDRLIALSKKFGFKIQGHVTNRNKHDSVMGVAMMASAFVPEDGQRPELKIPWADDKAISTFGPLLDELRAWTPTKRGSQLKMDAVMALWFAWVHWESVRHTVLGSKGSTLQRAVPSWMRSTRRGVL